MKYLGTTNDNLDLIPKSALTDHMLKSVYDTDNDGVVDDAEKLGGQSPDYYAKATNGIYYAKTAGNGVAQVATIAGITQYYDGLCVALIFNVATRRDATININNLGAVPLRNNTETASSAGDDNIYSPGGAMRIFVYDSANSLFRGVYDYSTDARIHRVTTEGSNVAKQADRITQNSNYFHAPCYQLVYFNFDNTAQSALTLNLWNGPYVGAQAPIYINGEASSATNYTLPKGLYLVLWDGTNFYINTNGTLPGTQAPLTFDSTPTDDSTNPVTSGGVYDALAPLRSVDSVPTANSTNLVTSGGVYGVVSNRNLLDNWYFVGGGSQQGGGKFPINQRGRTSYQTAGYSIDRWALANAFICTPEPNGLRLNPNNQNNRQFLQSVENAQQYAGKTLTLSVMIPENTATLLFFQVFGTVIDPGAGITGLYSRTITAPTTISDTSVKIRFNASQADTGNALISAIKLELGSVSTLANDAPPSYGEELARCLNSTADASDPYANAGFGFGITNPNLLDNAYFVNPVNQRGQTAYTGGYSIDRWKLLNNAGTLNVVSGGIQFTNTASGYGYCTQKIENLNFDTTPCTFSLLTSTGALYTNTVGSSILTLPSGLYFYRGASNEIAIRIPGNLSADNSEIIVAMKVEIGAIQTLAHKQNGVWVLNEIPNYGQELAKCQRYFYMVPGNEPLYGRRAIGYAAYAVFRAPTIMRATPTATKVGGNIIIYGQNGNQYGFSSFDNQWVTYNAFGVNLSQNATYAEEPLVIFCQGGKIALSAEE